jgi:hypothetical protein
LGKKVILPIWHNISSAEVESYSPMTPPNTSLKLLCGAKTKVISEALKHTRIAFTIDTCSHIISGMQEDAMELLDGVLPSGVAQRQTERQNLNPASCKPA